MLTGMQLIKKLKTNFDEQIIHTEEKLPRQIYITIHPEALIPLADFIINKLGFRFLVNVGSDEVQLHGNYVISHLFSHDEDKLFLCVRVHVDPANPFIESITPLVSGANWAEREARDMVGVHPKNHPDPRRLVLADDWPDDKYPLRKDFPYNCKPPSQPKNRTKLTSPPEGAKVVPIGPFFPVLEEPAYFKVFVEGEKIVGCDYRGFYNHRGIEKLGDSMLTYNQICFVAERICGICGFVHSCCYCQAVEKAASIEVPQRAQYIRTIMLELERIHSHLLWLGIAGHIIGFDTILMQSWRIREPVMWLCEQITGNRKTYGMNLVGGVRRDIPKQIHPKLHETIDKIEKELKALVNAILGDISLHARLKNVGVLTNEKALDICVVGPVARGSGIKIDSRIDHPYAAYDKLNFKRAVHEEGGCWARTLVRLDELFESVKIIRQALTEMPKGNIMGKVGEIPHNKEAINTVEAPRGEAVHYVLTGGDNRPYRWKVRAPTYPNLQAVPTMIQDEQIADVPITIGSLDPCFSCTERMIVVDNKTDKNSLNSQDLIRLSREKTDRIRKNALKYE
jgi:Ni,Fe-hydrogenase III large subunit/Ni,Fe-hydrogenase III component G